MHAALVPSLLARAHVLSDERFAAPLCVDGGRFVVHVKNGEVAGYDGDAGIEFILPAGGDIFELVFGHGNRLAHF